MVRTAVATLEMNSKKLEQVVNTVQNLQVRVTAVEEKLTAVSISFEDTVAVRVRLCVSTAPCQWPEDDPGKALCY
jgi:hypothetical protein